MFLWLYANCRNHSSAVAAVVLSLLSPYSLWLLGEITTGNVLFPKQNEISFHFNFLHYALKMKVLDKS